MKICTLNFFCIFCFSKEYRTADPPRVILNKLESRGYRVIGMTGIGQTCIWTCHKENDNMIQVENNGGS